MLLKIRIYARMKTRSFPKSRDFSMDTETVAKQIQ